MFCDVCMYVCVWLYIYIHIYIYTHIHIRIHIHIHIHIHIYIYKIQNMRFFYRLPRLTRVCWFSVFLRIFGSILIPMPRHRRSAHPQRTVRGITPASAETEGRDAPRQAATRGAAPPRPKSDGSCARMCWWMILKDWMILKGRQDRNVIPGWRIPYFQLFPCVQLFYLFEGIKTSKNDIFVLSIPTSRIRCS